MTNPVNTAPIATSEVVVREWQFPGDTRQVRLLRTDPHRLVCQVFDIATQQSSRLYLNKGGPKYEGQLLQSMHPELVNLKNHTPSLSAIFIGNHIKTLEKWQLGFDGAIETRLIKMSEAQLACTTINTTTNQFSIWREREITEQQIANSFPEVIVDAEGLPNALAFHERIQTFLNPTREIHCLRKAGNITFDVLDRATGKKEGSYFMDGRVNPLPTDVISEFLELHEIELLDNVFSLKILNNILVKRSGKEKQFIYYKSEDNFRLKFIDKLKRLSVFFFSIPELEAIPIADRVDYLKNRNLELAYDEDDTLPKIKFLSFESLLDKRVILDSKRWAVTLASIGRCHMKMPITWGGHAVLLVEGVEDGYFMKKIHLVIHKDQKTGLPIGPSIRNADLLDLAAVPAIPLIENMQDKLILKRDGLRFLHDDTEIPAFEQKTETWPIPANKLQEMLGKIQREIDMQNEQLMFRYLHPAGEQSALVEPIRVKIWESIQDWRRYIQAVRDADPEAGNNLGKMLVHPAGKTPEFVVFLNVSDAQEFREAATGLIYCFVTSSPKIQKSKIEQYTVPANCLDWCSRNLQTVGINLPLSKFRRLISLPKEQTFSFTRWLYSLFSTPREEPEALSQEAMDNLPVVLPETVKAQILLLKFGLDNNSHPEWRPKKYSLFGFNLWMNFAPDPTNCTKSQ